MGNSSSNEKAISGIKDDVKELKQSLAVIAEGNDQVEKQTDADQSQASIKQEVESATMKLQELSDRMNTVEDGMEERKQAEKKLKNHIDDGDKHLSTLILRMQANQDQKMKIKMEEQEKMVDKKLKQQQDMMKMQLQQQQEIMDKQMKHANECVAGKLQLLDKLGELKARSTPQEYSQTLNALTTETLTPAAVQPAVTVPLDTICTEELDYYDDQKPTAYWPDSPSIPFNSQLQRPITAPVKPLQ